ncbi:MAG TPA: hypothetical protein VMM56_04185 [Planctomycetaceae bacterium]|nr:hypothetical protein [Planctomycetaceae bacterium]
MNSLKWNPGLLLVTLTILVFSFAGCQTTHWSQGFSQTGVPMQSAPIPESDLGPGADSLMRNESNPSDEVTTRKPADVARTPNRARTESRSNAPAPSSGKLILLGKSGTKPLSQYFEEDFQTEVAAVKKFPVTETPNQPADSKSELVRKVPDADLLEYRLNDFDINSGSSVKSPQSGDLTGPDLPLFTDSPPANTIPALKVEVPENIPVGNASQVTVTVSGVPPELADLFRLKIRFPAALRHPNESSQEFDLKLPALEGNAPSKVSFPIIATEPGTHSFEVSLRKGEEELSWKKISVFAKAGLLSVALTGPQSKPLGANAEYTLNLHNRSQESLGPITAVIEFDGTLIPREASEGAEQKSGRLVWQFPVLHPDEQIFLQVEFECPVESAKACITARVQAGDRPPLQEQSCLKIFRPNGSIRVEVEDQNDLARPGQELTAIVRITNLGLVTARDVRLSLDLPETLKFKSHTATLGNNPTEIPLADQLIQLLFEPAAELKPDQTLEFQITFEALKAGTGILQARVIDRIHTDPLTAAEPFTVTP